jgi:hypothetical protein
MTPMSGIKEGASSLGAFPHLAKVRVGLACPKRNRVKAVGQAGPGWTSWSRTHGKRSEGLLGEGCPRRELGGSSHPSS